MSKTLLFETKSVLSELKRLRKSVDPHFLGLTDYESMTMVNSFHKGSTDQQFYLIQEGTRKKKYIGTDKSETVCKIKNAKYYKMLSGVLDRDIRLLEKLSSEFVLPQHDVINSMLPKVYRVDVPPELANRSQTAAEWKKRKEAEKAKYAPFRPEDLKYPAQDETMMRSLSEVLIANYLLSLGITFVYELPLVVNGKRIIPDFTILSPVDNKTVIIIEHQGAMDSEKYQEKYMRTLLFYLGTNLVPNKDVFFTFNRLDRVLDLRQIDYILHTAFGFETPRAGGKKNVGPA